MRRDLEVAKSFEEGVGIAVKLVGEQLRDRIAPINAGRQADRVNDHEINFGPWRAWPEIG